MSARKFTFGHSLAVIGALGWSDFILKYRGSILGYLWSLLSPLVKFSVILYIFGPYVSDEIPLYPLYLFLGVIIWEHFAVTTTACMTMLHEKESIIQRMVFPRILLIFAVGWTNLIVFFTHFVIFLVAARLMDTEITVYLFYVPLIILQMTMVALGVGMLLSSFTLKYRDIPHLWNICIGILFWLTPIMYPYELTGGTLTQAASAVLRALTGSFGSILSTFIHTQPLSIIIHDARRVTLYSAVAGTPTLPHALGVSLSCALLFAIGIFVFRRRSPYFVQEY